MQALAHMHKPVDDDSLKAAKHRMAFEELFLLQLKLLLRREVDRAPRNEDDVKGISITQLEMMHAGTDVLGFTLTPAQDRVLTEVSDYMLQEVAIVCCTSYKHHESIVCILYCCCTAGMQHYVKHA